MNATPGRLWSLGDRVLPHVLVVIDDLVAMMIDGKLWVSVPGPEVDALLLKAHERNRSAICGPENRIFFEFDLFADQFQRTRAKKACAKLERRLRAALSDRQQHGRN